MILLMRWELGRRVHEAASTVFTRTNFPNIFLQSVSSEAAVSSRSWLKVGLIVLPKIVVLIQGYLLTKPGTKRVGGENKANPASENKFFNRLCLQMKPQFLNIWVRRDYEFCRKLFFSIKIFKLWRDPKCRSIQFRRKKNIICLIEIPNNVF